MYASKQLAVLICVIAFSVVNIASAQEQKLGLNDVSWLWPVPKTVADLDGTISMGDLIGADGSPAWSDDQLSDLVKVVEGDATDVDGFSVMFGSTFSSRSTWHVAGMRIDPTAPGAHAGLRSVFGSSVQIRLIIQPVLKRGGSVSIHDTAVHLVYDFNKDPDPANPRKAIPDNEKFADILNDIKWLKAVSRGGGVSTDGALGVHPGLKAKVPGLNDGVKRFLSKHLTSDHLSAMALAGIQDPEPWIFLALSKLPNGSFGPIPLNVPFAKPQMINFRVFPPEVLPEPVASNRSLPGQPPKGVATNVLFKLNSSEFGDFAVIGKDDNGDAVRDPQVKNVDIADVIANPNMSHFFNADCVSCHTESQRRSSLSLPLGDFAFKFHGQSPQRTPEVTSAAQWNVRNFGWFPDFFRGNTSTPTATQRTANESAEVLEFIEEHFAGE